jgi:hypothetical protein
MTDLEVMLCVNILFLFIFGSLTFVFILGYNEKFTKLIDIRKIRFLLIRFKYPNRKTDFLCPIASVIYQFVSYCWLMSGIVITLVGVYIDSLLVFCLDFVIFSSFAHLVFSVVFSHFFKRIPY